MVKITVERKGGLAGVGLAGSHLKSIGHVSLSDLSGPDQAAIAGVFAAKRKVRPAKGSADMFSYTLSRDDGGKVETLAVAEDQIPQSLIASIRDILD